MEFKSIIAKSNGNGELEFICHKEEKPVIPDRFKFQTSRMNNAMSEYDWRMREWEQSAQVFLVFSKAEENKIRLHLQSAGNYVFVNKNIDVTDFVEIRQRNGPYKSNLDWFAFYKSPSKEEPVTNTKSIPDPPYQPLFDLMRGHGLTLLQDEMSEIISVVNKMQEPVGEDKKSQESIWIDVLHMISDKFMQKMSDTEFLEAIKQFKITRLPEA